VAAARAVRAAGTLPLAQQDLGLAGGGQGETGVGGDGAIEGVDRAGVESQRQIAA
jgi:hypothetical protein